MLHESPVRNVPLGDMASKRRRKHLIQSSCSHAPTSTAQTHQAMISDNAIVQAQNHVLLPRRRRRRRRRPKVILTMEDEDSDAQKLLPNIRPPIGMMPTMSLTDNYNLQVRQGRYRIAYYQAMKPESGFELKNPYAYSDVEIAYKSCFKHLEDDECFEWFFHPDESWIRDLNDYQRIVLKSFNPCSSELEYPDVDSYRELCHTYEMDAIYVKYYGEISKKLKWIEDFLHMDPRSEEWTDMKTRGWRQALRIATRFPHMTLCLASFAYAEYIYELRDDRSLKDLDLVYFEIWRLVVKDKREYMDAVKEVHAMDKFHAHKHTMMAELTGSPVFETMRQTISVIVREGDIFDDTEDDKARDLFRKGVARLKAKNMMNYAEKKMEIAERLNLHKSIEVPGQI